MRGFVRLAVRETLTFRAFQRERRTFPVLKFAGVPLKVPFRKVSRKMSLANRMMCADDSPFHETKAGFRRVDVCVAVARIFIGRMIDRFMGLINSRPSSP